MLIVRYNLNYNKLHLLIFISIGNTNMILFRYLKSPLCICLISMNIKYEYACNTFVCYKSYNLITSLYKTYYKYFRLYLISTLDFIMLKICK